MPELPAASPSAPRPQVGAPPPGSALRGRGSERHGVGEATPQAELGADRGVDTHPNEDDDAAAAAGALADPNDANQGDGDGVRDDLAGAEWRRPDADVAARPSGRDPRFLRFGDDGLDATWRCLNDEAGGPARPLGPDPYFVRADEVAHDASSAHAQGVHGGAEAPVASSDRTRAPLPAPWRVRLGWPLQRRALAWGGRLVLALRASLQVLVRRLGPAELTLYEDAFAHLTTQVLHALVTAGAFDAMADGGPHAVPALAQRLAVDEAVLRRLLRYGATRGWVRARRNDRFALAHGGRPLRSDVPASMAPFVRYAADASSLAAAAAAPEALRRGGSGFGIAHGTSVWRWLADHPRLNADFDAAMATLSARDMVHVGRALAKIAPGDVCDLGGGQGALLRAALTAQPQVHGTLVERPEVLAASAAAWASAGLGARVTLRAGDLFALPLLRARSYLLRNVVHDWNDDDVVRILRGVRRSMRAGDALFLVETLGARRPQPVEALSDVAMLLMTDGGQQRDLTALRALAARAQLRLVARQPLPMPMQLLHFCPD